MKTYEQLTPDQQALARKKCLEQILEAILEGAIRFNDKLNKDNLQKRIDAACKKASAMQTPWFALRNLKPNERQIAMYSIDFETCTIRDVIARSIICHPSLLRDSLNEAARIHASARDTMLDGSARNSAQNMVKACNFAVEQVDADNMTELASNFSAKIIAFSCAAKLQLIPPATQRDIAARSD